VAARSKAPVVLDHSNTRIVGSSPTRSSDVMSAFFCVMLSCVDRGLGVSRSPVEGVLPICLNGFMVSEVNSESEQAGGPNP
jgi:hypothetical protein